MLGRDRRSRDGKAPGLDGTTIVGGRQKGARQPEKDRDSHEHGFMGWIYLLRALCGELTRLPAFAHDGEFDFVVGDFALISHDHGVAIELALDCERDIFALDFSIGYGSRGALSANHLASQLVAIGFEIISDFPWSSITSRLLCNPFTCNIASQRGAGKKH